MIRRIAAALLLLALPTVARAQSSWNSLTLTWTATGDDSLTGTAAQYDLRMSTAPINDTNFLQATPVTGVPAPAAPGTAQTFTVTGLQPSTTYYFALKIADETPNWSAISNVVSKATSAAVDVIRPAAIRNLAVGFVWVNLGMAGAGAGAVR